MVKIICEGNDDKKFLQLLLNDLKKTSDVPKINNFDSFIQIMGGKSKLLDASEYKLLNKQIGTKIKKVLFIFDCDFEIDNKNCNGMEKSQQCFDKLIKELDWNIEIDKSRHLHIFNRNLDYFLVETINTKKCYEHFDKLVQCLDVETLKPNKKPIANLYRDLYPYPQFDFKDDRFQPLKDKLIDLFKGIK